MVLLTSSSISVAISSSIVCMFTFLLFMSGYVMQQQTVKSLQDALHAPPVPRPKPTLPPQFQKLAVEELISVVDVAVVAPEEKHSEENGVEADSLDRDIITTVVGTLSDPHQPVKATFPPNDTASYSSPDNSPPLKEDAEAALPDGTSDDVDPALPERIVSSSASPSELSEALVLAPPLRLAYVLTVTQPSQICSALLFFREHSQLHNDDDTNPKTTYLLLYPSRWETDPSNEAYATALSHMRVAQDTLDITYHPVRTTEAWSGLASASIQSQLLGELQRYHWAFDRMLYLKTPGLATDIVALDAALSSTNRSLSKNWMSLSKMRSSAPEANDPSTMLLSEKGILVPRGELRGRLTISASTSGHVGSHADKTDVETASKNRAAYVYFTQEELEHQREDKDWYGSVFERYERGINEICQGSIFASEKEELRRR